MSATKWGTWFAIGAVAVACGGQSPPPRSPANEPEPSAEAKGEADRPEAIAPASPSPAAAPLAPPAAADDAERSSSPSPPPPPAAEGASSGRNASMARAREALGAAERDVGANAGDCRDACRALASMERAAGHLCDLAAGGDEARECDDAKKRVVAARDRVRASCGTCPGGPSLDRRAPIPSP